MRRTRIAVAALGAWALAVSLAASPALAQGQDKGPGERGERKDHITRIIDHRSELGLSEDQVVRLETVRDRYVEENKALRQQIRQTVGEREPRDESWKNLSREERREAMKKRHEELLAQHPDLVPIFDQLKTNREAMRNELQMILTPQQQDQLKQMRRERHEKAGRSGRGQGTKT